MASASPQFGDTRIAHRPEFVLTYAFAGLFAFYISAASFLA
jgi:hypothetical protein